jgi:hypothetical protein
MDEQFEGILKKYCEALAAELNAVYGSDCGFIITAVLKNEAEDKMRVQYVGNLEKQVACDFFTSFVANNDEEIRRFKMSRARPH